MPSSVINSFHYNAGTKELTVVFVSGMVYIYKKVPQHIYDEMKSAFSKGTYLNEKIKSNYEFEKK